VTLTRSDVQRLLDEHGVRPSRALGQNFVVDPNTIRRIVARAQVGEGTRVLEIGAGLGSLTLALAQSGAQVTAVEVDRYLVPILRSVVADWPVRVLEADAMVLDWSEVLGPPEEGPWTLVANLPYNVATPLVLRILESAPQISSLLVMVQREVGERFAAVPGSKAYGAVSVKIAYWARATTVGRVPPTVFLPRPNVDSVLVEMRRHETLPVPPAEVPAERLFTLIQAGFAHRRKMLRGALSGVLDPAAFAGAGIAPDARAEELWLEDWGRLAAWKG
jgi:16S rRNA (adenine1518-N6/adenine1519-N6)-dimethyltransferase